jgi:hypothetical protein
VKISDDVPTNIKDHRTMPVDDDLERGAGELAFAGDKPIQQIGIG